MAVGPADLRRAGRAVGVDRRGVVCGVAGRRRRCVGRSPSVTPDRRTRGRDAHRPRTAPGHPGPSSHSARGVWAILRRREPRDRPRHQAVRRDPRPRRADLRACRRARSSASSGPTARARPRRCGSASGSSRPTPARSAGKGRRSPSCRAGRGATCPRSAGCTRGWASSTSSSTSPRCTARRPIVARREALAWLTRFRIPDYADRRAEELSKGNQQKVQFIAAILHEPDVLLMDEPFTGLDPVNLVAAARGVHRAARPRAARSSSRPTRWRPPRRCASRSRSSIAAGSSPAARLRDLKRASGAPDGPTRDRGRARCRTGSMGVAGVAAVRPAAGFTELELPPASEPARRPGRRRSARGALVTRFEVVEPRLEALFIEHVGHPRRGRARAGSRRRRSSPRTRPDGPPRPAPAERRDRRPPRVPRPGAQPAVPAPRRSSSWAWPSPWPSRRSRIRYLDRDRRPTGSSSSSTDDGLAAAMIGTANSLLNLPPPRRTRRPGSSRSASSAVQTVGDGGGPARGRARSTGSSPSSAASGQLDVDFRRPRPGQLRSQHAGFAAMSVGDPRLDEPLPPGSQLGAFQTPDFASSRSMPRPWTAAGRSGRRRRAALPRGRLRRPAVHHDHDLRDVGRDGRRGREEQPGHGADDQRRLAAPAAGRQGRRDRWRPG